MLTAQAALASADVQITGDTRAGRPAIKERPRVPAVPGEPAGPASSRPNDEAKPVYVKIVLQSPVLGSYRFPLDPCGERGAAAPAEFAHIHLRQDR